MTHPLTDDVVIRYFGLKQIGCEKGRERVFVTQAMRSSADWQLEKVIEWLKDNVSHSLLLEVTDKGVTYPNTSKNDKSLLRLDLDWIVGDLREAMRPTNTQEDS